MTTATTITAQDIRDSLDHHIDDITNLCFEQTEIVDGNDAITRYTHDRALVQVMLDMAHTMKSIQSEIEMLHEKYHHPDYEDAEK